MALPPPLPGSRTALPPCYSIPALSLGWPTCCRRPALTRTGPHQHCRWRPTKGGRQPPAPRGLVVDGPRIRRLQGGLPPRPGGVRLTRVEQRGCWMDEACQIGREEIALGASPTGTGMPTLRARFLLDPATVARLG